MNSPRLCLAGYHYNQLKSHLISNDGLESAAILVCGITGKNRNRLCVSSVIEVPNSACIVRKMDEVTWPGEYLDMAIDQAEAIQGSVVVVHSHPQGTLAFSDKDNNSDQVVISSLIHGTSMKDPKHGSAIITPDGSMIARVYSEGLDHEMVEKIIVVDHDIREVSRQGTNVILPFSSNMTNHLSTLTACVVGVSGTGSIVAELLARLGIGRLILIDFDLVKLKNLNRILNSTLEDANLGTPKTEVFKRAIGKYRPSTEVISIQSDICEQDAIRAASGSDIIFCCTDSVDSRYYCDLMSQYFVVPLIDMGVTIPTFVQADGSVNIADVCGRVDYVRPGGSMLWDRNVVTSEGLSAEYLRKVDPREYKRRIEEGYLKGIPEEAPSVISLNMKAASLGVNEWLARLYKFRHIPNEETARIFFSLAAMEEEYEPETDRLERFPNIGQGLCSPLLGLRNNHLDDQRVA